jgi:hypothetical protein
MPGVLSMMMLPPQIKPRRLTAFSTLSRLHHAAFAIAVYASRTESPQSMQDSLPAVRHTLPGRVGYLQGSHRKVSCFYAAFPLSQACPGAIYFCPSSQKRTLLFSEYMKDQLLLALPHRQFVFTFPKLLRPYFRHNRRLFSEVSRLIFAVIERFYTKAAKRPIKTGMVPAYQSSGEFLRFNPHFHCPVLEGGFDETGRFQNVGVLPLGDPQVFLKERAYQPHTGNQPDQLATLWIFRQSRHSYARFLRQRPKSPLSVYRPATLMRFLLELTQHIPPRRSQYIRRYGSYASCAKDTWPDMPHMVRLAPAGCKERGLQASDPVRPYARKSSGTVFLASNLSRMICLRDSYGMSSLSSENTRHKPHSCLDG